MSATKEHSYTLLENTHVYITVDSTVLTEVTAISMQNTVVIITEGLRAPWYRGDLRRICADVERDH